MNPPAWRESQRGRMDKESLAFLLLRGSGLGGPGRLGFHPSLPALVDASGCIHKFLLPGVKGMADVANTDEKRRAGGAGFDHIATSATDFRRLILRMDVSFHNRAGKTRQQARR